MLSNKPEWNDTTDSTLRNHNQLSDIVLKIRLSDNVFTYDQICIALQQDQIIQGLIYEGKKQQAVSQYLYDYIQKYHFTKSSIIYCLVMNILNKDDFYFYFDLQHQKFIIQNYTVNLTDNLMLLEESQLSIDHQSFLTIIQNKTYQNVYERLTKLLTNFINIRKSILNQYILGSDKMILRLAERYQKHQYLKTDIDKEMLSQRFKNFNQLPITQQRQILSNWLINFNNNPSSDLNNLLKLLNSFGLNNLIHQLKAKICDFGLDNYVSFL